jgi:hypothetical protein
MSTLSAIPLGEDFDYQKPNRLAYAYEASNSESADIREEDTSTSSISCHTWTSCLAYNRTSRALGTGYFDQILFLDEAVKPTTDDVDDDQLLEHLPAFSGAESRRSPHLHVRLSTTCSLGNQFLDGAHSPIACLHASAAPPS